VGKTISVEASYTDGYGTVETVSSSSTAAVLNVNRLPTGSVDISGLAQQGQTLTVSHTLSDADGLGAGIGYQWLVNGEAVSEATGNSFALDQTHVGKVISVKATYLDGYNTRETVSSLPTAAVANVNDAPTGSVEITNIWRTYG